MTSSAESTRVPRLLSVRAVAETTTLPLSTVYDLIARGEIPHVAVGGRGKRVREDDLLAWIDSRREVAS